MKPRASKVPQSSTATNNSSAWRCFRLEASARACRVCSGSAPGSLFIVHWVQQATESARGPDNRPTDLHCLHHAHHLWSRDSYYVDGALANNTHTLTTRARANNLNFTVVGPPNPLLKQTLMRVRGLNNSVDSIRRSFIISSHLHSLLSISRPPVRLSSHPRPVSAALSRQEQGHPDKRRGTHVGRVEAYTGTVAPRQTLWECFPKTSGDYAADAEHAVPARLFSVSVGRRP